MVGDVYRFLATEEGTKGKYALWEATVPPGGGPPPQVHSREEEGFYILKGQITIQVGDARIVATAGMFAYRPVGTLHSFKNESDRPAKMLISVAPAGLEQMFFEVDIPVDQGATTALQDGIVVYFVAWQKHIRLYPPISGDKAIGAGGNHHVLREVQRRWL